MAMSTEPTDGLMGKLSNVDKSITTTDSKNVTSSTVFEAKQCQQPDEAVHDPGVFSDGHTHNYDHDNDIKSCESSSVIVGTNHVDVCGTGQSPSSSTEPFSDSQDNIINLTAALNIHPEEIVHSCVESSSVPAEGIDGFETHQDSATSNSGTVDSSSISEGCHVSSTGIDSSRILPELDVMSHQNSSNSIGDGFVDSPNATRKHSKKKPSPLRDWMSPMRITQEEINLFESFELTAWSLEIRLLDVSQRLSVASLLALTLASHPRRSSRQLEWEKSFLHTCVEDFLALDLQDFLAVQSFLEIQSVELDMSPTIECLDVAGVRCIIVRDLIAQSVFSKLYDARSRVLVRRLTSSLRLPWKSVSVFEQRLASQIQKSQAMAETHSQEESRVGKSKRWLKVGLAAVGGGALMAVTGGLAAPAILAGMGMVGVSVVGGTAAVTTLFGATGAGLVGMKMRKRMVATMNMDLRLVEGGSGMHVTVCCSGFDVSMADPWINMRSVLSTGDYYNLVWEPELLQHLELVIKDIDTKSVSDHAFRQLARTTFVSVLGTLAWPATIMRWLGRIDSPWALAASRAKQCGLLLAEALMSDDSGCRPLTLVGFSMGARLLVHALQELGDRNVLHLVENVVLLGSPVTADAAVWEDMARVVSGRLLNVFSTNDIILKYVYRIEETKVSRPAGLGPVHCSCVENVDVSDIVTSHSSYPELVELILTRLGLEHAWPTHQKPLLSSGSTVV